MKEKIIKVLKVAPNEHPEAVELENELSALQRAVSIGADYTGLIEIVGIDDGICILCNEEGKVIGLEANRRLGDDILCGVFYVTGEDKSGNLASLFESDMELYKQRFWEPEQFSAEDAENLLFMRFYPMD